MAERSVMRVSYTQSCARVEVGGRTLEVDRRDDAERAHTCPIELITAALGS